MRRHVDLWSLPCGARADVPSSAFRDDFQVIVGDYEGYEGMRRRRSMLHVLARPYADFEAWAQGQEPDWDRGYLYDAAAFLHREKLIPDDTFRRYESKAAARELEAAAKSIGAKDAYWLGYDLYLDGIGRSIASGEAPPLVTVRGRPVDGRHRTLAAMRQHRQCAPVVEVTEDGPIDA